jgi:hypothetical protein
MPATARKLNLDPHGRKTYTAQYVGRCSTCGGDIHPGDAIFYATGNDTPSGADCCAHRPDSELVIQGKADDIHTDDDGDPAMRIARVMPRGKTPADMCRECFMVHSPGQRGCD